MLTTTLRLLTVRRQVAEVQRAESIRDFGRPVALPGKFRLQLVEEGEHVMEEADPVVEVTLDVGPLHRSPPLLDGLGRREGVVDSLPPVEVDGRDAVLHRVRVPQLEGVVAHLDPQQCDLRLEEVGDEAAAGVLVVESLAQLVQGP